MSFLPAYREKHGITEVVVIVVGNGCRQVAEMFGEADIVALCDTEMDELVQAIIFTREADCIIAHHDLPYKVADFFDLPGWGVVEVNA